MNTTAKRVLITGGAQGLGKSLVAYFKQEGWQVAFTDIQDDVAGATANELLKDGDFYQHCDVRNQEHVNALFDRIQSEWGYVDVIINNAGVGGTVARNEKISVDDWQWVMDINVFGIVRMCNAFTPMMKSRGSGHIVNIASAAGLLNAPTIASYSASKAAVVSLSETQRIEWVGTGINVTVVCPGFFPTQIMSSIRGGNQKTTGWVEKAMQRSGISAEDVARLIGEAIAKKKFWVLPHKSEKRLWLLKRYWPSLYFSKMVKRTVGMKKKVDPSASQLPSETSANKEASSQ